MYVCLFVCIYIYLYIHICIFYVQSPYYYSNNNNSNSNAIIQVIIVTIITTIARLTIFNINHTSNLPTKILDFRGFDSSIIIIIVRGGILMSIGNFLESLSQAREILRREIGLMNMVVCPGQSFLRCPSLQCCIATAHFFSAPYL